MQELLGCVQRTKPVRSQSERHKLVVCFVQLHVLPKTEEKWVNNLRWAYKSIVFAVSKELGADEGLQMFLDTFPTKIPPGYTNLEMFTYTTWKHDAPSVSQCRPVSVCGQRRPLALVTPARERVRGGGVRYYQALVFVVMMTTRHTHTQTHTHWIDMQKHLFLSEPLLSLLFSPSCTHRITDTRTKAWKLQLSMQALSRWVA